MLTETEYTNRFVNDIVFLFNILYKVFSNKFLLIVHWKQLLFKLPKHIWDVEKNCIFKFL